MRQLILVLCAVLMSSAAYAGDVGRDITENCAHVDMATGDDNIYLSSKFGLDITLEDGGSGVVLSVYTCTDDAAASCDLFYWDPDISGSKTQNTLDGNGTTSTRGVRTPNAPVIRLEVTTAPSAADLARVSACRSSS